ncbi:rubrerythrin-like [Schistocerca gregaria]|uniref:rubrerythrin-like n=1 Tax=Schistocerca gregaria TaxID=7010 RepID=UPI00211E75F4|nr:rubrerythrin-like [Schistocerca gregaria]
MFVPKRAFITGAVSRRGQRREYCAKLKGTKTHDNLKEAFTGESMANRRYNYFAQRADIEGHSNVASVFRETAEGETGHAFGHLEFLKNVGDPVTNLPIGNTLENLHSAMMGETHEYTDMYPSMAKVAREEGFEEIGEWFSTLARAERSHAKKFQRLLEEMSVSA